MSAAARCPSLTPSASWVNPSRARAASLSFLPTLLMLRAGCRGATEPGAPSDGAPAAAAAPMPGAAGAASCRCASTALVAAVTAMTAARMLRLMRLSLLGEVPDLAGPSLPPSLPAGSDVRAAAPLLRPPLPPGSCLAAREAAGGGVGVVDLWRARAVPGGLSNTLKACCCRLMWM